VGNGRRHGRIVEQRLFALGVTARWNEMSTRDVVWIYYTVCICSIMYIVYGIHIIICI